MTYDLLREWLVKNPQSGIHVAFEQFVTIHHCVLSHASDISKVSKIYTHPQAWGQVTDWLSKYPHLDKIDSSSTSKAAEIASESGPEYAAISSSYAAEVHNIPIIERNIENIKDNTTRFLVLSKKHTPQLPHKFITFLAFTVEHEDPGALARALQILTDKQINLTSITSRPSINQPWHYVFFIEFWIDQHKDNLQEVLMEFEGKCLSSVVLGQFPRSQRYYSEAT